MSGVVWTKFYWSDWESDPALKLCSLAAQGLWMRMLCLAAGHDPIGYVCLGDRPLDVTDLARLAGVAETEAGALLAELDRNGVFSRARDGCVYSRRMVREARDHARARKNGKLGGNPDLKPGVSLSRLERNPRGDNPPVKAGDKPHKPYASNRVRGPKSPLNPVSAGGGERAGGSPPPAGRADVPNIPPEVRAAIAGRMGEDWARAWLDPAGWRAGPGDGPGNGRGGVIVCRLGFAAQRVERDLRGWLGEAGVRVEAGGG